MTITADEEQSEWVVCRHCKGNGTIRDRDNLDTDCPRCDGEGGWER